MLDWGGIKARAVTFFDPTGPWLVTRGEVLDPKNLNVWLELNCLRRQIGNSRTMIFSVAQIVICWSCYMTSQLGDVICIGAPPCGNEAAAAAAMSW
ncbi:fumarylacetoacetate hydrolase family protein [Pseudomonas alvandae]|uniref:fumarylacetoacetate hydrolase family protein n=1 Tax=Pseudomonas canavaninivorans TaxID=2842348 RepID=UPI002852E6CB|nr:fumarylacetoacetate hydrolase family protein [Pseudomonas canavaninivorans]